MKKQKMFNKVNTVNTPLLIRANRSLFVILTMVFYVSCGTSPESESASVSNYFPIIKRLSNQGNWQEAIEIAKLNLHSAEAVTPEEKIALYLMLGESYRLLEEYELAEIHFRKVVEDLNAGDFSEYLGEAYYGLGDLNYLKWSYLKQDDALNQAETYLDTSMSYAKKGSHPALESKVLYRLGTIYQIQGNNEKSAANFEKGLEISFSNADTLGIIRNDIHKAAELESVGILDSALFHYTRAYEYAKAINRNYAEAHALCNLGLFYYDREEIATAKKYFEHAKFLSEELKHRIIRCRSYYGLSLIAEKSGNKAEAIEFANSGLALAKEKGYKNYEQTFTRLIESHNQ